MEKPETKPLVVKVVNCGCREWVITRFDKLQKVHPKGTEEKRHDCEKIAVYQIRGSMSRIYVIKQIKRVEGEEQKGVRGGSEEASKDSD